MCVWPQVQAEVQEAARYRLQGPARQDDSCVCKTPWSVFQDGSDGGPTLSPATFGALRRSDTPSKAAGAVAAPLPGACGCPASARAPEDGRGSLQPGGRPGHGAPLARSCPPGRLAASQRTTRESAPAGPPGRLGAWPCGLGAGSLPGPEG